MGLTIELGWWLAPAAVTALVGLAYFGGREPYATSGFPVDMVYGLVCVNVAQFAWLIWAVLT